MKTRIVFLALLAGCGEDMPAMMAVTGPPKLVEAATVAAVSSDQKFLAYYTQTGLLANGQLAGSLSVRALDRDATVKLDDGAFGAVFGRGGEVLYYATGQAASTDAGSK